MCVYIYMRERGRDRETRKTGFGRVAMFLWKCDACVIFLMS